MRTSKNRLSVRPISLRLPKKVLLYTYCITWPLRFPSCLLFFSKFMQWIFVFLKNNSRFPFWWILYEVSFPFLSFFVETSPINHPNSKSSFFCYLWRYLFLIYLDLNFYIFPVFCFNNNNNIIIVDRVVGKSMGAFVFASKTRPPFLWWDESRRRRRKD